MPQEKYGLFPGEKEEKIMKICRKAQNICQKDGYVSVMTNCVELRIWFLTDQIIRIRAGFDKDFESNSLEVFISFLRKKLNYVNAAFTINSIRGVGYQLAAKN